MKNWLLCLGFVSTLSCTASAQTIVDFEELQVFTGDNPAGGGRFYNGNDGSGTTNRDGWSTQGVYFNNHYNGDSLPDFDFWEGWAYSNVVNPTTPGFANQYASIAGGGADGNGGVAAAQNYAIAFGSASFFNLPENSRLESLEVTNTTYGALAMIHGDSFTKQFGGSTGDDPDLMQLTFTGYDGHAATGSIVGSVTVDLADYRFSDNSQDFVLTEWSTVNLSPIATSRSVGLSFTSTDTGEFGINTPTYVAVDNLRYSVVPEPLGWSWLGVVALGVGPFLRRHGDREARLRRAC